MNPSNSLFYNATTHPANVIENIGNIILLSSRLAETGLFVVVGGFFFGGKQVGITFH